MANVAKLYNVREHVKELLAEPLDCSYEKHYSCVFRHPKLGEVSGSGASKKEAKEAAAKALLETEAGQFYCAVYANDYDWTVVENVATDLLCQLILGRVKSVQYLLRCKGGDIIQKRVESLVKDLGTLIQDYEQYFLE